MSTPKNEDDSPLDNIEEIRQVRRRLRSPRLRKVADTLIKLNEYLIKREKEKVEDADDKK